MQIDGAFADWTAVLADPDNHFTDAPGTSAADRDAPVPGDRDLLDFAYTWDATNLFFYVQRTSGGSTRRVLVYVDRDDDGRMDATDQVILVRWWSAFGLTLTTVHGYVPSQPGGDLMVDGGGFADGHTLPGGLGGGTFVLFGSGGSGDGRELEFRVPWSAFGLAPGSAVSLHAAMARNDNIPFTVQDNMAGAGGGPLSTGFAEVVVSPDRSLTAPASARLELAHTVANIGNAAAPIELWTSWGCSGTPATTLWHDVDGNGAVTAGVDVPLADTNGDGNADIVVAGADSVALVVETVLPGGIPGGTVCALGLHGEPRGAGSCGDLATDTITFAGPLLTLVKSSDRAVARPGDVITYTTTYTNAGADTAFVVVLEDPVPGNTEYVPGSATGGGATLSWSHDGGNSFDTSETLPVTHVRWTLVAPLASGAGGSVGFRARVQ